MECCRKTGAKLSPICGICCRTICRHALHKHSCTCEASVRPSNLSCLQAQLAVSSQGLPVLCTVIKEDREDLDMLRTALECLQLTIGHPANHLTGSGKVPNQNMMHCISGEQAKCCLTAMSPQQPKHSLGLEVSICHLMPATGHSARKWCTSANAPRDSIHKSCHMFGMKCFDCAL